MKRRFLILAAPTALLCACAQAPTQRLAASTEPLQAVRLFVWSNGDAALGPAALETFTATLRRSGLTISQVSSLQRPLQDLNALERAWADGNAADGSHALVLTRQHEQQDQGVRYVRYEAVLWDPVSRKLVWKASLGNVASVNPLRVAQAIPTEARVRADRLAGDLLRGLDRDGLFALAGKPPRDAKGQDIPATLIPIELR